MHTFQTQRTDAPQTTRAEEPVGVPQPIRARLATGTALRRDGTDGSAPHPAPHSVRLLRRGVPQGPVRLSFVLLDWSCRESLHMLDYLAAQDVPREQYEVLWIEFHDRVHPDLQAKLETAEARGEPAPVDTWAVLGLPQGVYYHKHLMYDAGLLLAHGEIVCFCDSDTMVKPGFVASVLRAFDEQPDLVLHHDEIRNHSPRFHPFRYPTFEDVLGPGCRDWVNGRTLGLWDDRDPLHTRNYGACMSAPRRRLLEIGGADMHRDYLGHVCGPYEMTFRLVNAGLEERWCRDEFLYHVWHPGQAGDRNYVGPHDGRQMSTTALEARRSGRTAPLAANPAIEHVLRTGRDPKDDESLLDEALARLVRPEWLAEWDAERLRQAPVHTYRSGEGHIAVYEREEAAEAGRDPVPLPVFGFRFGWAGRLRAAPLVAGLMWRQFQLKRGIEAVEHVRPAPETSVAQAAGAAHGSPDLHETPDAHDDGAEHAPRPSLLRRVRTKLRAARAFFGRMLEYDKHLLRLCWLHLRYVAWSGCREIVLYGEGEAARILTVLAKSLPLKVRAICPVEETARRRLYGTEVWDRSALSEWNGTVLVAAFVNCEERVRELQDLGVPRDRIVVMP